MSHISFNKSMTTHIVNNGTLDNMYYNSIKPLCCWSLKTFAKICNVFISAFSYYHSQYKIKCTIYYLSR